MSNEIKTVLMMWERKILRKICKRIKMELKNKNESTNLYTFKYVDTVIKI